MPFVSRRQKWWLKKHKPDIYKLWDKETPKGVKLPYRVKKRKSAIEQIRIILAQQPATSVAPQAGTAPAAPAAPATPGAPQAPAQQGQYSNIDFNAAIAMIPQIMGQLDSSRISDTKNYMITNLKVDPTVAEQATTSFAVKIYKEELAKRQQQVVQEVGKKLGIDPSKIPNLNQASPLPALPGMGASVNRRIRLANIIQSSLVKRADISSIIDSVNHLSSAQKISNLYKFLSNFDSINEGVQKIFDFISGFPPAGGAGAMATAQISKKIGVVAAFLWVVSFILALNAAGASDYNAKYWNHITNSDKLAEAQSMMLMLKSFGISAIVTAISGFFKKREEKERQPINQGKKLYEPFNK